MACHHVQSSSPLANFKPDFVLMSVSSKSNAAILTGFGRETVCAFSFLAVRRESWSIWNEDFSGSFSDAGLKKLDTALLVVIAAIFLLTGGGERSLAVELGLFVEPMAVLCIVEHIKAGLLIQINLGFSSNREVLALMRCMQNPCMS